MWVRVYLNCISGTPGYIIDFHFMAENLNTFPTELEQIFENCTHCILLEYSRLLLKIY